MFSFFSLPRQKPKINKWDLIKLTVFWTAKETITKQRDSPLTGRKYVQMIQPRRAYSKIYKELIQLKKKKITQSKNGQKSLIDRKLDFPDRGFSIKEQNVSIFSHVSI